MKDEEIDACMDVDKIWCFVSALLINADTPYVVPMDVSWAFS